jgi:hypothetical protein
MDDIQYEKPVFTKAILAGLFSGFFSTCVALFYNIVYRGMTHYNPSQLINISSIIFSTLILAVVAGVVLYLCITYIKTGGVIIFRVLFLILFVVLAMAAVRFQSGPGLPMYEGFTGLLFGLDIIFGVFIVILIPYFYKHHELFLD